MIGSLLVELVGKVWPWYDFKEARSLRRRLGVRLEFDDGFMGASCKLVGPNKFKRSISSVKNDLVGNCSAGWRGLASVRL